MFRPFNILFVWTRRALLVAVLGVAGCQSPEERAQSYYESGMKRLSQQDYLRASIEFKNALQLKKDLVEAWRGLAQIEQRNHNWPVLSGILRTIVELDAQDVDARITLARLLTAGNALDEALNLVNAAGEVNDRHPRILVTKAVILFRLNDIRGAVREARAALEIDSTNAEAMIILAADRLAQSDPEGALLILSRTPADRGRDIAVQLFKLKIFEHMQKPEQIEAVLRTLIEKYPEQPVFRRHLIKHQLDHKRLEDAERELRALAAAYPDDAEAGRDLIRFLQTVRGPDVAREELLSRIKAGVRVFLNQMTLADFELRLGNPTEAISLLEKLTATGTREEIIAAQLKLVEIHLSRKNIDVAEAIVTEILRKDNRNTSGLKLRAIISTDRGQFDAAIADARQALSEQPRSAELMLVLATAYERSGSIDLAEKQYADATKASSFDATVGLSYVAFLRRRGNIAGAEDILIELASRQPDHLAVLSTLADVRLQRQNWTGAQEIAERIKKTGSDRTLADQILGLALSAQSRHDESISILQAAHAAAPASIQPLAALINALVRAEKTDRAVALLHTVLAENPENAEAHVLLGSIYLQSKEPEQAAKSFRTAIERQPKNVLGYRMLTDYHFRANNLNEAMTVARAGLEQEPDDFALHFTLGSIYERKGDYEAAIAEYEYLLKRQSGSMIVTNNLASLLADHRTDKASLERAYSLAASLRKSEVPHFKDTLGWIYYQRGEHRSAISLLEEAAAALPDMAMVRYHLGMSYVAVGRTEKAAEELRKALELSPDEALQRKIRVAQEKAGI